MILILKNQKSKIKNQKSKGERRKAKAQGAIFLINTIARRLAGDDDSSHLSRGKRCFQVLYQSIGAPETVDWAPANPDI
jgi:hypothetical protein